MLTKIKTWRFRFVNLFLPKKLKNSLMRLPLNKKYQTIEEGGDYTTKFKVSYGRVRILQEHYGRATSVSIPVKELMLLSEEVKKAHRKEKRRRRKG